MRILVIEDYPDLGPVIRDVLTALGGHDVTLVETCAAAVETIQQADASNHSFQVVVAAVRVSDGLTMHVCKQLESRVRSAQLRFVALSADWSRQCNWPSWMYFKELHVRCIAKAFQPGTLLGAVQGK